MFHKIRITLILGLTILIASCCPSPEPETKPEPELKKVTLTNLKTLYKSHSDAELPNFQCIQDVKTKKKIFFGFILELVRQHDEQILKTREAVLAIQKNYHLQNSHQLQQNQQSQQPAESDAHTPVKKLSEVVTKKQHTWLKKLAKIHRVTVPLDAPDFLPKLLLSVDVIPASMAMAQAANESAWGTSRFATSANNLFGQWCFQPGCGLVPQQRPEGETYEVKVFSTPSEAVGQYMLNINRNKPYSHVRKVRQKYRKQDAVISGLSVVEGLEDYSARGHAYIEELQSMIRFNKLSKWDNPNTQYPEFGYIKVSNCL